MPALPRPLATRAPALAQALRVTIGSLTAFAAYRLLDLAQGYWAVFTVVIVMQGTVGGTLGAAVDRLAGTVAGALLGGVALAVAPPTPAGMGLALAIVTALTVFAAARRPRLKVAPVTAAILLLSQPPGLSPEGFVLDRIVEIALGGVIGVAASRLILPTGAYGQVIARAAAVLDSIAAVLRDHAASLASPDAAVPVAPDHVALRRALAGIEQAVDDAGREQLSRLAEQGVPDALPRSLWRVRNSVVLVGRALDGPLPEPVVATLGVAAARLLEEEAALATRAAAALREARAVDRGGVDEGHAAFEQAFGEARAAGLMRALDFDAAGRVFGLAFTAERLRRDMDDLVARVDELAARRGRTG